MKRSYILGSIFLIYGLAMVAFLAFAMPPFQNADELAHFLRADQVSSGIVIGSRNGDASGGLVDAAIFDASTPFSSMPSKRDVKVTPEMTALAGSVLWQSRETFANFSSSAIYPPFFYLPAAFGIDLGKSYHASVVRTLQASRILTGVISVLIAAFAIFIAGRCALWLFAILSLPMSMAQMTAVSQDGLMFALSAVAASIVARSMDSGALSSRIYVALCGLISVIVMARPPYAPLVFLLFMVNISWAKRVFGASFVFAVAIVWGFLATVRVAKLTASVSPGKQIQFLIHHPLDALLLPFRTLAFHGKDYAITFVGQLGWLDTPLPKAYIYVALVVIALAYALVAPRLISGNAAVLAVALLSSCVAILAIQYLTWTAVGASVVEGVQGRYFIPLALFLCVVPRAKPEREWKRPIVIAVALFPAVSALVTVSAVLERYYG